VAVYDASPASSRRTFATDRAAWRSPSSLTTSGWEKSSPKPRRVSLSDPAQAMRRQSRIAAVACTANDHTGHHSRTECGRLSTAQGVIEICFTISDLKPITTIGGFNVKHVSLGNPHHALHRGRHVLVHSIRELNDDHGALTRRTDQFASDRARTATKLAEHDLHDVTLAIPPGVCTPFLATTP
jgi:hypothetical protein